jgi:hypothetical protein
MEWAFGSRPQAWQDASARHRGHAPTPVAPGAAPTGRRRERIDRSRATTQRLRELDILCGIAEEDTFQVGVAGGPDILTGTALRPPPLAEFIRTVAADLAGLQPHTSDDLVMPDIGDVTESQLGRVVDPARWLAASARAAHTRVGALGMRTHLADLSQHVLRVNAIWGDPER